MRRLDGRRRLVALTGVVAVTAVAGLTVAWAQIPAANGTISACYHNQTGALRVIDAEYVDVDDKR